jgi:pilus assembly protein Flp/PilA
VVLRVVRGPFVGLRARLRVEQGSIDVKNFIVSFVRDESGASAAEYALLLAIVAGILVFAAIFLGGEIADALADAACIISSGGTKLDGGVTAAGATSCA